MRLVLTRDDRIGVLRDGGMVDVSDAFADVRYRTAADRMPRVLAMFRERRPRLEEMAARGETMPLPELQAPVPRPPKLIAAFGNYREGSERERQTQDMFLESPDSVIGPNGTVVLPNHPATIFHHEAELALVVGQRAKDLPADERALDALVGYTCAIDVSARGLGRIGPSRIGKSFDTFAPCGPWIVTKDEIPDPQNLSMWLDVNGERMQTGSTRTMIFNVAKIVSYVSHFMILEPGDVITTGTPPGVGLGMKPPRYLQVGDEVTLSIQGLGEQRQKVIDFYE